MCSEATPAQPTFVLAVYGHDQCAVCLALWPKLQALTARHCRVEAQYIDMKQEPVAVAQLGIFAAPVVRILYEGKELQRWTRHIGVGQVDAALARLCALAAD